MYVRIVNQENHLLFSKVKKSYTFAPLWMVNMARAISTNALIFDIDF